MSETLAILSEALDLIGARALGLYARDDPRQALYMDRSERRRPHLQLVLDPTRSQARSDTAPALRGSAVSDDVACDSVVQKAIDLMHAEPERRWTVTQLARRVGLSRPALARRFSASTGSSPLRYLTRLRMQRAAALLRDTELGLAQVGLQVGYRSEFAFNRAFKRLHRIAPGTFRRAVRPARTTSSFRAAA